MIMILNMGGEEEAEEEEQQTTWQMKALFEKDFMLHFEKDTCQMGSKGQKLSRGTAYS